MLKRSLKVLFIIIILAPNARAQDYVPGQVIVKFKSGASVGLFNATMAGTMSYSGGWSGMGLHQYALQPGASVTATVQDLQNRDEIEYVEPNYILRKFDGVEGQTYSKNDIQMFQAVNPAAAVFGMTAAAIHASDAWVAAAGSGLPVVAIIDSGIDMNHDVLKDALWTNPNEIAANGVDDDANGYVDDVHGWNFVNNTNNPTDGDGHGTHVSGIVRGTTQNLFAVPIDAPLLKLMPLKFLDDTGAGTTSNAINAIYYAVNNGARVLNNSWGGPSYSRALLEAISYSYVHHTLFVAAAGNSGQNIDVTPMYPASYNVPNVIAVAATTDTDVLASFSNYGPASVQVAGPGVSILSSYKNNSYAYLSGTSMAAPFVAGVKK